MAKASSKPRREAAKQLLADRRRTSRRFFAVLLNRSESRLSGVETELIARWPFLLFLSCLVMLPLVVLLRVVHAHTVLSDSTPVVVVGLLVGFVAAGGSVGLMWHRARRTRRRSAARGDVIGLVASVIAAPAALECAAAVTTAFWHRGLIGASGAPADLGVSERYYVHEMARSLEFLGIGDTVTWDAGVHFEGRAVGVIVIVLKAVLLLPLIRQVTSAYQWLVAGPAPTRDARQQVVVRDFGAEYLGPLWGYTAVWTVAVVASTWPPVVRVSSQVADRLARAADDRLPPVAELPVLGRTDLPDADTVSGWLSVAGTVVQWVVLVVALGLCCAVFLLTVTVVVNSHYVSPEYIGAALASVVAWSAVATLLGAAATWLLVDSGLATTDPPSSDRASTWPLLQFQSWSLVSALPGLKAPEVLGWTRPMVVDGWPAVLVQVGYRISAFVAIACVPWLVAALRRSLDTAPSQVVPPLQSAQRLAQALALFAAVLSTTDESVGPATAAVKRIRAHADAVRSTFGPGPVSAAADAAVATATDCFDKIYGGRWWHADSRTTGSVDDARARLEECRTALVCKSSAALRQADPLLTTPGAHASGP